MPRSVNSVAAKARRDKIIKDADTLQSAKKLMFNKL